MTDFNHKQASEQIARIYGVDATVYTVDAKGDGYPRMTYITQDLGALTGLAVRNGIGVFQSRLHGWVITELNGQVLISETYADHNNDPIKATCAALTKALIKKGDE